MRGRRMRATHGFVREDEFRQLVAVKGRRRAHRCLLEASRLRRCIRIECGLLDWTAAGPEAVTDDFVGISLTRNGVRAFAFRRAAPGETRDCQIETSPEKMHRTAFADKAAAEIFEHRLHR